MAAYQVLYVILRSSRYVLHNTGYAYSGIHSYWPGCWFTVWAHRTGAGLIIIPALMFFAHFNEKTAIGTSISLLLPPVGLFAAAAYWKHGNVNVQAALIIIIGFVIGSFFAACIAVNLPDLLVERIFGIVAILIGIKMLFSK